MTNDPRVACPECGSREIYGHYRSKERVCPDCGLQYNPNEYLVDGIRIFDSASSPHDLCILCAPEEQEAEKIFGNAGPGPDNRGNCFAYDTDHPPYSDGYTCESCGEYLKDSRVRG